MTIELAKNKISFARVLAAGLPDCLTKDYIREACNEALAALPDKPKSEDEIFKLLCDNASLDCGWHDLKTVIFILKQANVLYVEED